MNIISLSFFSEIWIHSYPEFLLYRNLNEKYKLNIDIVDCQKFFFKACAAHTNKKILVNDKFNKKNKVCKSCIRTTNFYKKNSNHTYLNLSNFINEKDFNNIKNILKKINLNNYKNLKVLDVDVGKVTLFNFLINNKLNSSILDLKKFEEYKIYLENSLKALFAFKNIIEKKKYDILIAYSVEYSFNKVCAEYAKLKKIKIISIAAAKNPIDKYNNIIMSEAHRSGFVYHANLHWNNFKKKTIFKKDLKSIKNYLSSMLDSKSYLNFSSPVKGINIREHFKISNNFKKVVLIALSGQGERIGDHLLGYKQSNKKNCNTKYFLNDLEWAKFLLKNSNKFPDTFFIFRPHPRDYSSRSDSVEAPVMKEYLKLSKQNQKNCVFNFKNDEVSLYDFVPYVDLLLNSSSVTSYEFGLFGVRTLIFDPKLYYYADDLVNYPKDFSSYLSLLRKTLNDKNYDKKKIILNAAKYLSIQFNYEQVDISDVFKINPQSIIFRIINRIQRYLGFNFMINFYFYFKNIRMKNISLFYKMLKNNYNSILDIRLKKFTKNQKKLNEFEKVKKSILSQLDINKKYKLYNVVNKIV